MVMVGSSSVYRRRTTWCCPYLTDGRCDGYTGVVLLWLLYNTVVSLYCHSTVLLYWYTGMLCVVPMLLLLWRRL